MENSSPVVVSYCGNGPGRLTVLSGGPPAALTFRSLEYGGDVAEDRVGVERRVDALVEASATVELDEGVRLVVIGHQPRLQRVRVVVGPSDQRLASYLKRRH